GATATEWAKPPPRSPALQIPGLPTHGSGFTCLGCPPTPAGPHRRPSAASAVATFSSAPPARPAPRRLSALHPVPAKPKATTSPPAKPILVLAPPKATLPRPPPRCKGRPERGARLI